MKRFFLLISIVSAALTSCKQAAPKVLVLYYSQTGITETVANEIQKQTDADICRFDVTEAYAGDFEATIQRCMEERKAGSIPTLAPLDINPSNYDIIFLGYPIWFGTYAPPVAALLGNVDLSGKTIVPFCTFGSGGLFSSIADLKKALPDSEIAEGYGVRAARISKAAPEVEHFLIASGYLEGEAEVLPDYSDPKPATPDESAIYHEATDGYPFPMGEAESVCSRPVSGGTDYKFIVRSTNPAGEPVEGYVYVIVREGCKPEFTQMVR